MYNPLLDFNDLPAFTKINPEHVLPAVQQIIDESKAVIATVLARGEFTWQGLCQPLAEVGEKFSRVWSPVSHLNSVKNSPELRAVYEQALPLLSEYSTWLGQHKGLYQAYVALRDSVAFDGLLVEQQTEITNTLKDFQLSGIALSADLQQRYKEIALRLSELSSHYSNNVLDATMAWSKLVVNLDELRGVPESALLAAQERAQAKGLNGYLLTLDMPSYLPILTYCDNRELRYELYHAYLTRASDQGPQAGQWDNGPIMQEILQLRHELAQLLGFSHYAEKSLATKMAENPQQVVTFLEELATQAKPYAAKDLQQLRDFAQAHYQQAELAAWDIAYYSEKQKQVLYEIDDEQLRVYFPENRVLNGLFEVVQRIFGVTVQQRQDVDVWCDAVRFYDLFDRNKVLIGGFYLDLYARDNKRSGAWMDECVGRIKYADGQLQRPIAYLTCNFNAPVADRPALFTHDEVITLFHEFGHGLHHLLTVIDTAGVAGIHGVPWDAVELPSQFLENWCWEPDALAFISGHYETGEPLPQEILTRLLAIKNYQAALFILRQLEFGLFDFKLHASDASEPLDIMAVLNSVKQQVALLPTPEWGRFPYSFSHIFAGGYAAGYYSYLWAEVLSADAFSRFKERGIFDREVGIEFLETILSRGGSESPMVLFKRFMGREPNVANLLTHYGIRS